MHQDHTTARTAFEAIAHFGLAMSRANAAAASSAADQAIKDALAARDRAYTSDTASLAELRAKLALFVSEESEHLEPPQLAGLQAMLRDMERIGAS